MSQKMRRLGSRHTKGVVSTPGSIIRLEFKIGKHETNIIVLSRKQTFT